MQRETRCSDFFLLDVNGKTNHPLSHRLAPILSKLPHLAQPSPSLILKEPQTQRLRHKGCYHELHTDLTASGYSSQIGKGALLGGCEVGR